MGEGCQPLPSVCLCQTERELQRTEMTTEGCWAGRHGSSHICFSISRFIKCRESPNHEFQASAYTVSGDGNQQVDTHRNILCPRFESGSQHHQVIATNIFPKHQAIRLYYPCPISHPESSQQRGIPSHTALGSIFGSSYEYTNPYSLAPM